MKFTSLEGFYSKNPARRDSPEIDFGTWHPRWRLTYTMNTGELYRIQGDESIKVLAVIPPNVPAEHHTAPYGDEWFQPEKPWYVYADAVLQGWSDHWWELNGMDWVQGIVDTFNARGINRE